MTSTTASNHVDGVDVKNGFVMWRRRIACRSSAAFVETMVLLQLAHARQATYGSVRLTCLIGSPF